MGDFSEFGRTFAIRAANALLGLARRLASRLWLGAQPQGMHPVAYAIDTHAAVKKFERAGLNAQQAEAVAEVINGAASEQVTKQDFAQLRRAFEQQASKTTQHGSEIAQLKADVAQLKIDVAQLKIDVAQLKIDVAQLKADVAQLRRDFNEKFATKEELARQGNKVVIAMFAGLGLLFTALQVFQ